MSLLLGLCLAAMGGCDDTLLDGQSSTASGGGNIGSSSGSASSSGGEGGEGGSYGMPPAPQLGDIEIVLAELDGKSGANVPVSFAHVFAPGHYQPGDIAVQIVESLTVIPAQIDVLRLNDDGSVRHALISTLLPKVDAGQSTTLRLLHGAGPTASDFASAIDPNELDARFEMKSGSDIHGSLSDIIADPTSCQSKNQVAGDTAYLRFDGPIMKQCVTWGKLRTANGPHDRLDYSMRVTTYSGWEGAKIDLVVENTHAKLSANDNSSTFGAVQGTNAKLLVGASNPATVWSRDNLTSWVGTRFRVVDWFGTPLPDLEKRYQLTDLVYARALNMLNTESIPLDYDYVSTYLAQKNQPAWPEPGESGVLTKTMSNTGDRGDIGPQPTWDNIWLATMNRDALRVVEGVNSNGTASIFGNHFRRSAKTTQQAPGGPIGIPCGQWTDLSLPDSITKAVKPPGKPDTAHQPRIGFLPYLITGDLFYLEELQFWTIWNAAEEWPYDRCIVQSQTRGTAWSGIRAHTDMAWITPEADDNYDYAQWSLGEHFKHLAARSTEVPGLFPNVTEKDMSKGLKVSGRDHYVNARRSSTWAHAWLGWALQMAAKRGYAEAAPLRDWYLQLVVDLYTVEDDPSQCFVGPDQQSYCYPSVQAFPYDIAVRLYEPLQACSMDSDADPGKVPNGLSDRPFVNWGELYYWSLVNKRHKGFPYPNWCPSDKKQWSPDNGLNSDDIGKGKWHEYGGTAAAVAILESALDGDTSTRSAALASKAQQVFDKYLQHRLAEESDAWDRLVPVALPE